MPSIEPQVRQRADLTFKHNKNIGRHGWLRLTPAYSVKLVREILQGYMSDSVVLDPFSGTGTTPLCVAEHGNLGWATDINPFLVWLGNAKVAHYRPNHVERFKGASREILDEIDRRQIEPVTPPPIHNINRWWDQNTLDFLCKLKSGITKRSDDPVVQDLLKIALCRTCISLSNAAFNHQSMSFKDQAAPVQALLALGGCCRFREQFEADVRMVASGAYKNPSGNAKVVHCDARMMSGLQEKAKEPFDALITSPPYPNRMSYIRELRPYMYWLGYLQQAREAGELDWEAIGGTWGVATSRLANWVPDTSVYVPEYLHPTLKKISASHEKNGHLMAQYVWKYFQDMGQHFQTVRKLMKKNGMVYYIVGNSSFYGHVVPVEQLYSDMLEESGFQNPEVKVVRKRNSKKSLFEYLVSAHCS